MMRRLAQEGAKQIPVRETAVRILQTAGARTHNGLSELAALYYFVRDRVRFTRDPVGVEMLQSPRYTLHSMAGDCDDRATLLVALARSIGIPADFKFKVIAANRLNPSAFTHVYVTAKLAGRDIALDPTYNGTPMGWEYPKALRVGTVPA